MTMPGCSSWSSTSANGSRSGGRIGPSADGTAELTGYVAGISRENDESEVLSYAVFLDHHHRVIMIEPADLERA
jgi:hypothetical protein